MVYVVSLLALFFLNNMLIDGLIRHGRMFVHRYQGSRAVAALLVALAALVLFCGFIS